MKSLCYDARSEKHQTTLICFLQLPQHTAITSLNNTNPFVSTLHTELSVKCKLNWHAAFKWRSQRVLSSEVIRPGRIGDRSYPSSSEVTNEWSYISTPLHTFSRRAPARRLPPPCLTTYIIFDDSTLFHFLLPRFTLTSPQRRGSNSWESSERYNYLPFSSPTT